MRDKIDIDPYDGISNTLLQTLQYSDLPLFFLFICLNEWHAQYSSRNKKQTLNAKHESHFNFPVNHVKKQMQADEINFSKVFYLTQHIHNVISIKI